MTIEHHPTQTGYGRVRYGANLLTDWISWGNCVYIVRMGG